MVFNGLVIFNKLLSYIFKLFNVLSIKKALETKPGPDATLSERFLIYTDLINTPLAKFNLPVTIFKQ